MNSRMDAWTTSCGLLHSEICGSMLAYNSPQLIAVNHVLHRLPMPRHSLCALFCFTICSLVLLLRIFASLLIVVFVTTIDYRCIWLTHSIFLLSFYSVFKLHFLCPFPRTDINRQLLLSTDICSCKQGTFWQAFQSFPILCLLTLSKR